MTGAALGVQGARGRRVCKESRGPRPILRLSRGEQPLAGEQAGVMGPCRGDGGLLMTQGNQRGQRKCGTLGKVRT